MPRVCGCCWWCLSAWGAPLAPSHSTPVRTPISQDIRRSCSGGEPSQHGLLAVVIAIVATVITASAAMVGVVVRPGCATCFAAGGCEEECRNVGGDSIEGGDAESALRDARPATWRPARRPAAHVAGAICHRSLLPPRLYLPGPSPKPPPPRGSRTPSCTSQLPLPRMSKSPLPASSVGRERLCGVAGEVVRCGGTGCAVHWWQGGVASSPCA